LPDDQQEACHADSAISRGFAASRPGISCRGAAGARQDWPGQMRVAGPAGGAGQVRATRPAAARREPRDGFTVSDTAREAATAGPPAATGLDGLLGVQEAATESVRDRAARRHGHATLKLLDALHRAMLGGNPDGTGPDGMGPDGTGPGGEDLARLAALQQGQPPADDPRLADALKAIATRVAVELARRGWPDIPSSQ